MPFPSGGSRRSEQRSAAFGPDQHELVAQQLRRNVVSPSYGAVASAELRELVTHVPVWNGMPSGPATASTTDRVVFSRKAGEGRW